MKTNTRFFTGILILCMVFAVLIPCCKITFDDEVIETILPPGEVTGLTATPDLKKVTLSWTNPTDKDFVGIEISCIPPATGLPVKITDKRTTYDALGLTSGIEYAFTIKSFDKDNKWSKGATANETPTGSSTDTTPPANVTQLTTTDSENDLNLSWANPTDEDFNGVTISVDPPAGDLPVTLDATRTSFRVSGLTKGKQYTFIIRSLDTVGNISGGTSCTASHQDTTPPGPVSDIIATPGNKRVTLSWTNPTDADFNGVKITASPALEAGEVILRPDVAVTAFPNLLNDTQYTFTIVAIDTAGNKSAGKNITATPKQGTIAGGTSLILYKRDKDAFDFGYCGSATTKEITLTADAAMDVTATITPASGAYTVQNVTPATVTAGQNFTVSVTYTPSSPTSWDEADLSLGNGALVIRLIGSGYKQPKDIVKEDDKEGNPLRLWLRADMISEVTTDTNQVKCMPDYSGNGFDAIPPEYIKGPLYVESGIGGLPSMEYVGSSHHLIAEGTVQKPIVSQANGTTTFIVFKFIRPTSYSAESVITACSSPTVKVYPELSMYHRYCDEDKGYGTSYLRGLCITGNGYGGSYRWLFGNASDARTDTAKRMMETITSEDPYSVCMVYDGTVDTAVAADPNTKVYVNGVEKFLSFTYSNSGTIPLYKEGRSPSCYGSYGQPISNGWGGRYGDLGNDKVDTTEWETKRNNLLRKDDFAFSYTPWITQSNASGATYFTNKVRKNPATTGTIKTMYIGPNQSFTSVFNGQISEVFVFDRALTDDEITDMNAYIKNRYGIGE